VSVLRPYTRHCAVIPEIKPLLKLDHKKSNLPKTQNYSFF